MGKEKKIKNIIKKSPPVKTKTIDHIKKPKAIVIPRKSARVRKPAISKQYSDIVAARVDPEQYKRDKEKRVAEKILIRKKAAEFNKNLSIAADPSLAPCKQLDGWSETIAKASGNVKQSPTVAIIKTINGDVIAIGQRWNKGMTDTTHRIAQHLLENPLLLGEPAIRRIGYAKIPVDHIHAECYAMFLWLQKTIHKPNMMGVSKEICPDCAATLTDVTFSIPHTRTHRDNLSKNWCNPYYVHEHLFNSGIISPESFSSSFFSYTVPKSLNYKSYIKNNFASKSSIKSIASYKLPRPATPPSSPRSLSGDFRSDKELITWFNEDLNHRILILRSAVEQINFSKKSGFDSISSVSISDPSQKLKLTLLSMIDFLGKILEGNPDDEKANADLAQLEFSLGISTSHSDVSDSRSPWMASDEIDVWANDPNNFFYSIRLASASDNNCLIDSLLMLTQPRMTKPERERAAREIRQELIRRNLTEEGAFLSHYYHGSIILELIGVNPADYTISAEWSHSGLLQPAEDVGNGGTVIRLWNTGVHYEPIMPTSQIPPDEIRISGGSHHSFSSSSFDEEKKSYDE